MYSPRIDALVDLEKLPELGPGRPDRGFPAELRKFSDTELFAPERVIDPVYAQFCRSALLLHRDCLDESHAISQEHEGSQTGNYLHGVMHRREPDFGNAKYWFRRVRNHPIEGDLFKAAQRIAASPEFAQDAAIQALVGKPGWDAFAFVDLCEQGYRKGGKVADYCRRLAREEWRLLFDYCFRQALGTDANDRD